MDNFLVIRTDRDELYCKSFDTETELYYVAANYVCFADCSGEYLDLIVAANQPVRYAGWQPDMLIEFYDKNGVVTFSQYFPEWEH